jgi:hypothetical protein
MTKKEFLALMRFPKEWEQFEMYPEELADIQINGYQVGHESASEHDRCGAFHWWLKQEPSEQQLINLMKLTYLDPDPLMSADVRNYIVKAKNFSPAVAKAWQV